MTKELFFWVFKVNILFPFVQKKKKEKGKVFGMFFFKQSLKMDKLWKCILKTVVSASTKPGMKGKLDT